MGKILLTVLLAAAPAAAADRVVLRTSFGDLVVALNADDAPRHVERFAALARAGGYDGAALVQSEPGRYLRFRPAAGKAVAPPQDAPEPGRTEFTYGTVFSAKDPADPSGASFAILLARVPAMDGRFTALGAVEAGADALELIRNLPRRPDGRPIEDVVIAKAYVTAGPPSGPAPRAWLIPALLLVCGLAMAWGGRSRGWRLLAAAGLAVVLAGFFLMFAAYLPHAAGKAWLGFGLLAGAIAVFRLMGGFES